MERKIPNELEELRIENCTIETTVTARLLEQINNKRYLKKLGLVNANFSVNAMKYLSLFVEHAPYLIDLDLSRN